MAWWTRRRYGPAAGLAAAALCAFDPNLIAHGRYVTTDFPVTAFFFFACVLWVEYLEQATARRLLAAAAAIGLALITKFSAVLLIPAAGDSLRRLLDPAAEGVSRPPRGRRRRNRVRHRSPHGAVIYWPETVRCWRTQVPQLSTLVVRGNPTGEILFYLGRKLHLPAHAYLFGLNAVADHNAGGHSSYLLGMRSETGWWYYFPVVFAVKSTMAALAAAVLLLAAALWQAWKREWISPMTLGLALPPLLYFVFSMTSGINIGMRHILPVYPFLYVGAAAWLTTRTNWRRGAYVLAALVALQIGECARITPDYLAFFNELAGGPGPRTRIPGGFQYRLGAGRQEARPLAGRPRRQAARARLLFRQCAGALLRHRRNRLPRASRPEGLGRHRRILRGQRHPARRRVRASGRPGAAPHARTRRQDRLDHVRLRSPQTQGRLALIS